MVRPEGGESDEESAAHAQISCSWRGEALARVLYGVLSQRATYAPPFAARSLSLTPVTPKFALRARRRSRRSSGVRDEAWREEGGTRVAEGYAGDPLYHM